MARGTSQYFMNATLKFNPFHIHSILIYTHLNWYIGTSTFTITGGSGKFTTSFEFDIEQQHGKKS